MDEHEEFIRDAIGAEAYQPEAETAALRYALRAIEERRELLAALKLQVGGEYTEKVGCVCYACAARALIAKCEAP